MRIDIGTFGGLHPVMGNHLLPDGGAVESVNCMLGSGMIKPLERMSKDHNIAANTRGSMFRFGNTWLHYADVGRRFVHSRISDPERLLMSKAAGGLMMYTTTYGETKLGVVAPSSAPGASVVTGTPDESTDETQSRTYVYTCVDLMGEESAPSPASTIVTLDTATQVVALTGLNTPTHTGHIAVNKKRIYRLATGTSTASYLFVAEINENITTYTDTKTDGQLGEALSTLGWLAPSESLKGLCALNGGVFAAFNGREVRLSEPYAPYAWPDKYAFTLEYDIVQLAVSENTLFILTKAQAYYMVVDDIDSAVPIALPGDVPCLSARCAIEVTGGVVFPSRGGLYMLVSGASAATLMTGDFYDRQQWLDLVPANMFGVWYAGCVFIFSTNIYGQNVGLILDITKGVLTTTDIDVSDAVVVPDGQRMFIASNGVCWEWEGNRQYKMKSVWRSKTYLLDNPTNFSAAVVETDIDDNENVVTEEHLRNALYLATIENDSINGSTGMEVVGEIPFTGNRFDTLIMNPEKTSATIIEFYGDGVLKHTQTITNRRPFALPAGFCARTWYVRVISSKTVRRVAMAESMAELF